MELSFSNIYRNQNWDLITGAICAKTSIDVEFALSKEKRNLQDFMALISPAAAPYLEQMAQLSSKLTQKRFGKTIQLFAPLYVSNVCSNTCKYCGFNTFNKIERTTLTDEQILKEVEILKGYGFEHILIVTGESSKVAGIDYLLNVIKLVKPHFVLVSMEVQPLEQHEYQALIKEGLNSIYVYQETYHFEGYKYYHEKGKKSDFFWRLETPDRLGRAGIYKIGLGVLLGLEDWRTDSFFTALHLDYLEKTYWKTKYSISFPRLRPAKGIIEPKVVISDKELTQLICAYRIFNGEIELSLSTRENSKFRNNVMKLGVTAMSAGSRTNPGGYAMEDETLEQFEIADSRTPKEFTAMIKSEGYEVVWKDWDDCYLG